MLPMKHSVIIAILRFIAPLVVGTTVDGCSVMTGAIVSVVEGASTGASVVPGSEVGLLKGAIGLLGALVVPGSEVGLLEGAIALLGGSVVPGVVEGCASCPSHSQKGPISSKVAQVPLIKPGANDANVLTFPHVSNVTLGRTSKGRSSGERVFSSLKAMEGSPHMWHPSPSTIGRSQPH